MISAKIQQRSAATGATDQDICLPGFYNEFSHNHNETLEWVHYLLRFEPGIRLLLIGTVRAEEILPGHPLVAFLGALQRDGLVTEFPLGPLTTTETTSLAEHIMGQQLDPAMSNTLYHETEGNPLFVVEMVRAGTLGQHEEANPTARSPLPLLTRPASTLPAVVQTVLATRLAQLSPLAHEVANVAAMIGREFTFPVLARASGQSEDAVVQGLDELWQRRIVREQGAGTAEAYDFSHDKLRELACASLSPAHQRLLHRRIAEAFEVVYTGDLDAVSGQIAAHYEHAGLPGRAIPYYRRAGEAAMRVYANADAITAFQRAAALLEAGGPGQAQQEQRWEDAVAIYAALGDIFAITGRQQEARQVYQDGLASIPPRESLPIPIDNATGVASLRLSQSDRKSIWQARLLRKMASTWNLASDNPLDTFHVNAQQTFQEAERVLEQAEVKSSREWLQEWIQLQLKQLFPLRGSVDEMTEIIEKAQHIVKEYGTAEQRGQFFQAVIARDNKRDRYVGSEQSISYRRNALAEILQTDNKDLIGFAHFILARGGSCSASTSCAYCGGDGLSLMGRRALAQPVYLPISAACFASCIGDEGALCTTTIVMSSSCSQSSPVKVASSLNRKLMSVFPPGCSPIKVVSLGKLNISRFALWASTRPWL